MAYLRPSFDELRQRISADFQALPAVLSSVFSAALAQVTHSLHGYMDWLYKQCTPLNCDLERLGDWAFLYGVSRLSAVYASGFVFASGIVGTQILVGTMLRANNGLDYMVTAAATLSGTGQTSVLVRCTQIGLAGNLRAGVMSLIDPVAGCNSQMPVTGFGISGGADEESLEQWRLRVVEEWRAITVDGGRNGKPDDYKYWAKSAHPSITDALIQPLAMGPGTVIVRPICDLLPNRLPSPAVMLAVRNKLFVSAPATADWYLAEPTVRLCAFVIALSSAIDSSIVRDAIVAELKALIFSLSANESVLSIAKIDAAILSVTDQYVRHAPVSNVVALPGEVLVFNGVSF